VTFLAIQKTDGSVEVNAGDVAAEIGGKASLIQIIAVTMLLWVSWFAAKWRNATAHGKKEALP